MNILIGCAETLNPFVARLQEALNEHPAVDNVYHDLGMFWEGRDEIDVLHLQWPRALFPNWRIPESTGLSDLEARLLDWKDRARIVLTVHNIRAHNQEAGDFFDTLYRLVHRQSDGVIHMGHESQRLLHQAYDISENDEVIIPHGQYDTLPNEVTQKEAREELGISKEKALAVVLGALRSPEELALAFEGMKQWDVPEQQMLVAGRLTWTSGSLRTHATRWYQRIRTLGRPISFQFGRFEDEKLQYFLNAADMLLIPRLRVLNSGNVALGFTFGRVVVGPNTGVIGEVLGQTGNPVFDPDRPDSVGRALRKACMLSRQGKGDRNAEYARENMDWSDIAEQHVRFYRGLS
jgi:glycosyltransferase involved in cell wall biosynthesis